MSGSGESRIQVGAITQSVLKGKALESALAKELTSNAPPKMDASDPKGKKTK